MRSAVVEICDFCLAPKPPWTHYATTFCVIGDPARGIPSYVDVDGEWGACETCHAAIVADDPGPLLRALPEERDETARLYHVRVVNGFWSHRTGRWIRMAETSPAH